MKGRQNVAGPSTKHRISENESLYLLKRLRWPDGLVCPRCAKKRISEFTIRNRAGKKRDLYQCADCKYQYSATVGTPFHNSHVRLNNWFVAIWLMSDERNQPTTRTIQAFLHIPYKTAWSLVHRVREAMAEDNQIFGDTEHQAQPPETPNSQARRPLSGRVPLYVIASRLRLILGPIPTYLSQLNQF